MTQDGYWTTICKICSLGPSRYAMKDNKIFVVVPVFNGWQQTRTCINHLKAGTYTDFSIIVVDHGSTDGTKEGLKTEYPDVIHILGSPELWWTGATNLGIAYALDHGAGYVMLLNNDCYVDRHTLEILVNHIGQTGESVVAPVQRSLHSGIILTTPVVTCFLLGFPTLRLSGRPLYNPEQHELIKTKLIIGGRGVLIPRSVLEHVGLLDETNLVHYGSDHDFYLRCRKHHIPLFIAADAILDVDETRTTLAIRLGSLTLREFRDTLNERRSHRNLRDLSALFRLHYPIPGLWWLGVGLNLLRYTLVYAIARGLFLLKPGQK